MTVTGIGSTWTNSGSLDVGNFGSGTLTVSDGGAVSNTSGYIGDQVDGTGTVTVTGTGSTWTNSASLYVGNSGTGTLTIADDGLVDVTNSLVVASNSGSFGRLNIGAAAGDAATAAGTLTAASTIFGNGDGAIVFNHTDTAYDFDTPIWGAGAVTVLAGTTTLSGHSTYTGATSVTGGALLVDGQITSATTVSGTGIVGGTGVIGQLTVNSGGTLAPGNSIGTIYTEDTEFAAGSTFDLEVDNAGNSDVLASSGTVTIDASATLDITSETPGEDGATYPWSTSYTFITAGSVSGTFGTVTDSFAALDAFVDYTPTTAVLTLTRNDIDLTVSGTTRNQTAVAAALNEVGTSSPAAQAVLAGGPTDAPAAMDQLSGEIHASGQTHLLQTSQLVLSAAPRPGGGGRIGVTRGIGGASAESAAWGIVFGSWYENREDGNAATMDGNQFGVIAGATLIGDASRSFGVMLGLTETSFDVEERAANGRTQGAHFGFYGSTDINPVTLSFATVYATYDVETARNVAIGGFTDRLTAEYDASTLSFSLEASYDHYTDAMLVQPFAGLSYTRLNVDGYTEDGGSAALTVAAASHDLTTAHLGVRFDRALTLGQMEIDANGSIGYHHVFGDTAPMSNVSIGGSSGVDIAGAPLARDSFTLGLGAVMQLGASGELSVDYRGDFAAGARSHRASLSYEFRF